MATNTEVIYRKNPNYGKPGEPEMLASETVITTTPDPLPNTPNNPYFGKRPLATKDFYALVGRTLSADRFTRLLGDKNFAWVLKVLDHVDTVDPDDKAGQFLQIIAYLTNTSGQDGKPLMETAERDAIMGAWVSD